MAEEKTKNGFIFYRSYADACRALPAKLQLKLLWAIIDKGLDEVEPELDGVAKGMFSLIAPNLDANNARYKNGLKGAEGGKKGGRPKKRGLPNEDNSETPIYNNEGNGETPNENKTIDTITPNNDYGVIDNGINKNLAETPNETPSITHKELNIKNKELYTPPPKSSSKSGVLPENNALQESAIPAEDEEEYVEIYNRICVGLPAVKVLSEERRSAIKAFEERFSRTDFETVCEKASASGFLTGDNESGWKADFDFLIQPTNALKVLEGKYYEKVKPQPKESSFDTDDFFETALAHSYGNL